MRDLGLLSRAWGILILDGPIDVAGFCSGKWAPSHPFISFFLPFGGNLPLGILITFMTNKPEGRTYFAVLSRGCVLCGDTKQHHGTPQRWREWGPTWIKKEGDGGKETIIIPIPSLHPFRNFSITKETVMAMEGLQPKETLSSPQTRGKVPISRLHTVWFIRDVWKNSTSLIP